MDKVKTFSGSCHCAEVQFEIDTDLPELTTCDCSIWKNQDTHLSERDIV